eukprot:CAMPEP_0178372028 /NCGR_PEP_ID=MMETSP0689_2-20121128/1135_1 /TAXON_ID=160604 /ORGANISM="Amphidinium massartii, Strain CS-259" /LENGTH=57 /DNA_ID=CAMNT_0019991925 /DNA_START=600 /DNA_END=770 /DNA_ORIENTATION=+
MFGAVASSSALQAPRLKRASHFGAHTRKGNVALCFSRIVCIQLEPITNARSNLDAPC